MFLSGTNNFDTLLIVGFFYIWISGGAFESHFKVSV